MWGDSVKVVGFTNAPSITQVRVLILSTDYFSKIMTSGLHFTLWLTPSLTGVPTLSA
jgi:hypothetical protein